MGDFAAVLAIALIFGAPIAAFIVHRVLRHQERMEMLRRGFVPPPDMNRRAYREWRTSGAWIPGPTAPQQTVAPPPYVQPGWTPDDDPQRALYKGIRVALIGLALTLGLGAAFGGYRSNPAILGGLIPMFVGIAQIIVALLSGAQLPGVAPQTTFIPPPSQARPNAAPPPPFESSTVPPWAEQPGRARFEELSKPAPPPDVP